MIYKKLLHLLEVLPMVAAVLWCFYKVQPPHIGNRYRGVALKVLALAFWLFIVQSVLELLKPSLRVWPFSVTVPDVLWYPTFCLYLVWMIIAVAHLARKRSEPKTRPM